MKREWKKAKMTSWACYTAVGDIALHIVMSSGLDRFGVEVVGEWPESGTAICMGWGEIVGATQEAEPETAKIVWKWTFTHSFRVSGNNPIPTSKWVCTSGFLPAPCQWLRSVFTEAGWRNKLEAQDRDNELGGLCHRVEGTEVLEANIPHFKSMLPT